MKLPVALWLALSAPFALAQQEVFTLSDTENQTSFGFSLRSAGDIDADGTPDFMVRSPADGLGRVRIFSGATREVLYDLEGTLPGFGWSFDGMGDLDDDGHDDFVISEINSGPIINLGDVYVYSGATGRVLYSIEPSDLGSDRIGIQTQSVGDLDGDGKRELLVDSRSTSSIIPNEVVCLSGATGSILFRIEATEANDDQFGDTFRGIGDVNGDGRDDIAITDDDFFMSGGGGDPVRGRVLVYSGATAQILYRVRGGPQTGDYGRALAGTGDVDGDGRPDLVIASEVGSGEGQVELISGATGQLIRSWSSRRPEDEFGTSVDCLGDVDGDGIDDIGVGAPGDLPFIDRGGIVYIFSGATGEEIARVEGTVRFADLGQSVAFAGDLSGDGLNDILFGAPWRQGTGRVFCYSAQRPRNLIDFELDDDRMTALENGRSVDAGARFGTRVRITSGGDDHFGAAIFDSDPLGPNFGGPDPDLLVDRGNVLILQENPQESEPGVFQTPDDAGLGGSLRLELLQPGAPSAST